MKKIFSISVLFLTILFAVVGSFVFKTEEASAIGPCTGGAFTVTTPTGNPPTSYPTNVTISWNTNCYDDQVVVVDVYGPGSTAVAAVGSHTKTATGPESYQLAAFSGPPNELPGICPLATRQTCAISDAKWSTSAYLLPRYYTVTSTITPAIGGSVSPAGSNQVPVNNTITFTANPSSGYQLQSISGCGSSSTTSPYTTPAITGDCTVTAVFVPQANNAPNANAGFDQTITQPVNSTTLSGGGTDPDGDSITNYAWSFFSGPVTPNINNPSFASTAITGLSSVGTYTFRLVVTDSRGGVSSPDSVNITVNSVVSQPDLTFNSGPTPNSGTANSPINFSATVVNSGNASTGAGFTNAFEWSNSPSPSGNYFSQNAVGAVGASSSTGISGTHTFASAGTYYVRACADHYGGITESNESNNCSSWTTVTVVSAGPNTPPSVTISANPTTGIVNVVNPTISWSVTNSPSSCTASGDWSGSKSTSGGSQSMGVLTSARVYTYTLTCTNAFGSDTKSATVTVSASGAPDLIVSGAPAPLSATVNSPLTFVASVLNNSSSATGGSFHNNFEFRTGANGSGGVHATHNVSMVALGANSSGTATSPNITFSSAGTYSLQVCTDQLGAVSEANEGNNCSGWYNITVSSGGAPVVSLTANPTSVSSGGSSTLTWTTTNSPSSCTASGDWSGSKSTSGGSQSTGSLSSTAVYNLQCQNVSGLSNVASATVTVGGGQVDLTGGTPLVTTANAGVDHSIQANIINNTSFTAGASNYVFQVSNTINGAGPYVQRGPYPISNITANMNTTAGGTHNALANYSYRICVDATSASGALPTLSGGTVTESNESNNCGPWGNVTVTSLPPNLTASAIYNGYTTPPVGQAYQFWAGYRNIGTGPVGSPAPYFFQVATATNGGGTVTDLASPGNTQAPLSPNSPQYGVSATYTFNSAQTYSARLCVDKSNSADPGVITESNEGDNCGPWTDMNAVLPAPDYTMDTPVINGIPTVNQLSQMSSNFRNISNYASATNSRIAFYVNTGSQGSGVTSLITSTPIGPVMANYGPAGMPFSYTWPTVSIYSVRACADYQNSVTEQDENNNCGPWLDIDVGAPPVPTVSIAAVPRYVTNPGDMTTITWSSANAEDCSTDFGGSGTSGSMDVAVMVSPTRFNINCVDYDTNTQVSAYDTVIIGVPPNKAPIFKEN